MRHIVFHKFFEVVSGETKVSPEVVKGIIDKTTRDDFADYYSSEKTHYVPFTFKMVKEMVIKKYKSYKQPEPGDKIKSYREDLEKLPPGDLTGTGSDTALPLLPKVVTQEIIDNSVSKIHSSLHSHAEKIELLTITDQELREFTGILTPKGDTNTKIEALDIVANEYRLKALREAEPRKEQLYKNIQGTAELKADLITIIEEGGAPKNNEAISMFKEEIESNESVNDISRLEKFKKWIKENWLGASALIITVASLLTTVIIGMRHAIKAGAKAVKSFGQSVYKTFKDIAKKLGPILGPVVSAIGSLLSILLKYAAEGIAWLAKNLWALVIAIVYLIYSRYQK